MIIVYSGRPGDNTILVEHIDLGKEARRVARDKAPKAPATRKVADKRKRNPKHRKPIREEY